MPRRYRRPQEGGLFLPAPEVQRGRVEEEHANPNAVRKDRLTNQKRRHF